MDYVTGIGNAISSSDTLRVMKFFDEIFDTPETRNLGQQQCDLASLPPLQHSESFSGPISNSTAAFSDKAYFAEDKVVVSDS